MVKIESEPAVLEVFDGEVLKEILCCLRALPVQELRRNGSDAVQQAVSLLRAVSRPWAHDALLFEAVRTAGFLFGLLQSADMSLLQKSVEELQDRCRKWESQDCPDALGVFFLKHKTGLAIKSHAETRLRAEEGSAERDSQLNALMDGLKTLESSAADCGGLCGLLRPIYDAARRFLDEQRDATPAQIMGAKNAMEEMWRIFAGKLTERASDVLAACLQLFAEAFEQEGQVQKDARAESPFDCLDLNEALTDLSMADILDHVIWTDAQKDVPLPLAATVNRLRDFVADTAGFAKFLLYSKPQCHKVFQDKLPNPPSAETLHRWIQTFAKEAQTWLKPDDFRDLLPKIESLYVNAARTALRKLTLSGFAAVGALVQKCCQGDPHLEANAKALSVAQQDLPTDVPFRPAMEAFLKARLRHEGLY